MVNRFLLNSKKFAATATAMLSGVMNDEKGFSNDKNHGTTIVIGVKLKIEEPTQ